MKRDALIGTGILVVSIGVTGAFLLNLCHLVFGCGCHAWWSEASALCNMHSPSGRHCPWCTMSPGWQALALAGVVVPQSLLSFFPRRWPWPLRLGTSLLAFPVCGGAVGLVTGWIAGYWR